ncbi:hypothetical protein THRCLA_07392 [Thraustotheca clavata]|uniref:Major facilitator superfamily (MFS) profile domain-containing protein n=1 Tax=Thraustotheca clavata TaxID=74557 RepID=A0A1V9ZDN3_9STRA|nr:hypothetical protein THRCLA_07392 [Thraustotheca clavata]
MKGAGDCVRGLLVLSISFLLVFTSYNAIENLETSIIPGTCNGCDAKATCQLGNICQEKTQYSCGYACSPPFQESTLGNTTLGVVYLCFMISSMFGPIIPSMIGEKWSLVASSLCYGVFALANVGYLPLYSGYLRFAIHRLTLDKSIKKGSYLTRLGVYYAKFHGLPDTSSMGLMNGTFSAIYKMSQFTGNVLSSFVLGTLHGSISLLFMIYASISFFGSGLLIWLEPLQKVLMIRILHFNNCQKEMSNDDEIKSLIEKPLTPTFSLASVQEVWELTKDSRMVVLSPLLLFTGIQQGFISSEFTSNYIRESLGEASIGYVMAVFGVMSVFFSYVIGRVADRMGPMWAQLLACFAQFTAYFLCLWVPITKCDGQWVLILSCAVLFSLGEAAASTIPNVVLGQEFPENALNAFSLFRVYHSGAASLSFFGLKSLRYFDNSALCTTCINHSRCGFNYPLFKTLSTSITKSIYEISKENKNFHFIITNQSKVQPNQKKLKMRNATDCIKNALLLSLSFFLIFTSYSAIENLETSVMPGLSFGYKLSDHAVGTCTGCEFGSGICQLDNFCTARVQFACDEACAAPYKECKSKLGTVVLGTNYLVFALSSIAGPVVPSLFGEKASMVVGSLAYIAFALANFIVVFYPNQTTMHWFVMITSATLSGISASFLWISQGSYLTTLSVHYAEYMDIPETNAMGLFNGIFFAIFRSSQILGNLISSFVLGTLGWPASTLFLIYSVISFAGTLLLLTSIEPQDPLSPIIGESAKLLQQNHQLSIIQTIQSVFTLAIDKRMLTLTPLLLFNGMQQGFVSSEFTSTVVRQSLGRASIGNIMAVFGIVNVLSSFGFGRLADKIGTFSAQVFGFTILFAAYRGIMVVILGKDFAHESLNAFSLFRIYHAAAASMSFYFLGTLSFFGRLVLLAFFLVASIVMFGVHIRLKRSGTN